MIRQFEAFWSADTELAFELSQLSVVANKHKFHGLLCAVLRLKPFDLVRLGNPIEDMEPCVRFHFCVVWNRQIMQVTNPVLVLSAEPCGRQTDSEPPHAENRSWIQPFVIFLHQDTKKTDVNFRSIFVGKAHHFLHHKLMCRFSWSLFSHWSLCPCMARVDVLLRCTGKITKRCVCPVSFQWETRVPAVFRATEGFALARCVSCTWNSFPVLVFHVRERQNAQN